jgi:F-type H+-transporting ATPase subunit epsilon
MAVTASDIDEHAVQAAIDRANATLADKSIGTEAQAAAEAALARSLAQLHVKRHRHGQGVPDTH